MKVKNNAIMYSVYAYLMRKQRRAVTMDLCTTRRVTRFTETGSTGSQQSTDVCLTTAVWLSSMMIFSNTSPILC